MEILQTIWTALTTENEGLISIISILFIFIEMEVSMLLFTSILNIDSTKNQKFLYVFALSIIGIISKLMIPFPFSIIVNLISCPIFVFVIFKAPILKCILSELVQYLIFIIFAPIILNIYTLFFDISSDIILAIPIYKIVYSSILYFVIFLFYKFCKWSNFNLSFKNSLSKKNNLVLTISLIIGVFVIYLQSYILAKYSDTISLSSTILSISILLIYFIFNLYSLVRTVSLEQTTQDLEEEKLYNKTLTILYDNIRGFKHDFNNIVQAIGGYIASNNINDLKEYYNGLLEDCQKANNLSVLNPELINNPAIYSLLTSKYHKAEELGIKMNIETGLDLSEIKIKPYELSRLLGILLDNAIEASKDSSEKIINVLFRKDSRANRDLIIIENSYSNKDVNTDKIFEKGYTSKTQDTKNHGLGLWEVRQLLKKNNNLNLHTTKTTELFKQQLEIY